jgi:molybdopterin converting factor small subunit
MSVRVSFYSYFRDLAGVAETSVAVASGARVGELVEAVFERFPKLRPMGKCMLVAVGVDYQRFDFALREGDEVALFPPVQGG